MRLAVKTASVSKEPDYPHVSEQLGLTSRRPESVLPIAVFATLRAFNVTREHGYSEQGGTPVLSPLQDIYVLACQRQFQYITSKSQLSLPYPLSNYMMASDFDRLLAESTKKGKATVHGVLMQCVDKHGWLFPSMLLIHTDSRVYRKENLRQSCRVRLSVRRCCASSKRRGAQAGERHETDNQRCFASMRGQRTPQT